MSAATRLAQCRTGQGPGNVAADGDGEGGHAFDGALSVLRPGCGACNLTREADRERACRGFVRR